MNNPANQQIQVLKTVAKWADRFTCIRKIPVFGSFARCEAFSDVDIAVEYTTKDPSPECYTAVNTCSGELAVLWQILSGTGLNEAACAAVKGRSQSPPV